MIKKFKTAVPWACVISDFNDEETVRTSHQKEFQKANQKEFKVEK